VTEDEQKAADLLWLGMWVRGELPPEPTPTAVVEERPGPRAPRRDPSQGSSSRQGANAPDPADLFAHAITHPARGDGGWHHIN
jgi:hypothetical protein